MKLSPTHLGSRIVACRENIVNHATRVRPFAVAVLIFVSSTFAAAQEKKADKRPDYEPTKIWPVHLTLSADEWKAMQPRGAPLFSPPPKPPEAPAKEGEKPSREIHRNTFGMDLPWAVCTIAV